MILGAYLFNLNYLAITARAAVVDFEAVNSARFHSVQYNGLRAVSEMTGGGA
jgi:hypothetical protein